jgi:hypothetical protein
MTKSAASGKGDAVAGVLGFDAANDLAAGREVARTGQPSADATAPVDCSGIAVPQTAYTAVLAYSNARTATRTA